MFDLTGQVAIVTGSGSRHGIGHATAIKMAEQGAMVIVTDLSEPGVMATVDEICASGGKAAGVVLNVTDADKVQGAADEILKQYGHIDILANIAVLTQKMDVADMQLSEMDKILSVNFFGVLHFTKPVVEIMKGQNYGRIVSVASVAGKRGGGFLGGSHYSASKAGLIGFTKALAAELGHYDITANCVCPGMIDTGMPGHSKNELQDDEEVQRIAEHLRWISVDMTPKGRDGTPEEVAAAIVFLASREASFITGEAMNVNGGIHMC